MFINWHACCISRRLIIGIFFSIHFVLLIAAHGSVSAYESLEWRTNGIFSDIPKDQPGSASSAVTSSKEKSSKTDNSRSSAKQKKSRKLTATHKHAPHRSVQHTSLDSSVDFSPGADGNKKAKSSRQTAAAHRVIWAAKSSCLHKKLRSAIYHVARNWGRVRVNSTCRSPRHNRRVGGSKHSYHLSGRAADIRVWGDVRATARYLRKIAGGYKHYGGGLFHIDTGPRRSW